MLDANDILLIQRLAVFVNSFNQKPHSNYYYSEKLLTLKQKEDYENSIEKLKEKISVFENQNGEKPKAQSW